MEVSELTLWIARLLVLALMYVFLLVLVFALVADARAAKSATRTIPPVAPPAPVEPAAPAESLVPAQPAVSSAPAPLHLEVQSGTTPVTGRRYGLFNPLILGRGTECEISIPNRYVSTRHARIFPHEGHWLLEDLGSTNGTLVNGEAVSAPHPLAPGDRVQVGDTEFLVQ